MSDARDAFGRPTAGSGTRPAVEAGPPVRGRAGDAPAHGAGRTGPGGAGAPGHPGVGRSPGSGPVGPGAPDRARALATWTATVLVLLVGAAGIAATLHSAVDGAHDDPRVIAHAVQDEPFVDRSLLRAAALRRALDRIREAAGPEDRLEGLSVRPESVTANVVDDRDQARWLTVGAAGDVRETAIGTRTPRSGAPLRLLDDLPLERATRYAARRWAALRPDARDPRLTLIVSSITTSTTIDDLRAARPGEAPRTTGPETRWELRWSVGFEGVRVADRYRTLDRDGRPQP